MATFVWEGRTKSGQVRNGIMHAKDVAEVEKKLRAQAISPEVVKKKPFVIKLPKLPGGGRVPMKDIVIFTRQFSTMIDAGLPLVQCLEILSTQSENVTFRAMLKDIKETVEGGNTFADALKKHPKVFDELFTNLVAAGEVGGILDTILSRLATYIEKNMKLIKKVKSAMVYPVCIVIIGIAVMLILLYYVIPIFEAIFADFGSKASLPAMTQNLIDLSKWMRENYLLVFGVVFGVPIGIKQFKKHPKGRWYWDKLMLRMPALGNLLRKVAVAKFTRTLGTMISSGVPILDALEIVAKSAGNRVVEHGILHAREKISEGRNMAEPLAESGVFPGMVVQMIAVGESTGALDQMLNKIADFYDDEVDSAVDGLTALMEPVMLVFLGGMVGYFLIAMYLPIFELAGAVG